MSLLYDMAKLVLKQSELAGKTRIKMEDLIAQNPEGVIVDGFLKMKSQFGEDYYIFLIKDSDEYFTETTALKQLADAWLEEYTPDELNRELHAEPIRFKMTRTKTKQGKTFTKVEVFQ